MTAPQPSHTSTPSTEPTTPATTAMERALRTGAMTAGAIALLGTAAAVIWPTGVMYWIFLATATEAPAITAVKLLPWIGAMLLPAGGTQPGPTTAYTVGAILGASLTLIICSTGVAIIRAVSSEGAKFIG